MHSNPFNWSFYCVVCGIESTKQIIRPVDSIGNANGRIYVDVCGNVTPLLSFMQMAVMGYWYLIRGSQFSLDTFVHMFITYVDLTVVFHVHTNVPLDIQ